MFPLKRVMFPEPIFTPHPISPSTAFDKISALRKDWTIVEVAISKSFLTCDRAETGTENPTKIVIVAITNNNSSKVNPFVVFILRICIKSAD